MLGRCACSAPSGLMKSLCLLATVFVSSAAASSARWQNPTATLQARGTGVTNWRLHTAATSKLRGTDTMCHVSSGLMMQLCLPAAEVVMITATIASCYVTPLDRRDHLIPLHHPATALWIIFCLTWLILDLFYSIMLSKTSNW
ncbi:hypothetical protein F2Q70_00025707 [Brassica cretica]|uniref:Uncharacterized protein n=2 Tax=Brassica cretica TaxID=69181 RepID=A0A3N6QEZ9_BRACR|nr:hypothetical protein F2Q68_00025115 [Brassica cretica]KAF2602005.1 hypothetical protein F2Q70_00025707 [Brassica cretica]KAF3581947.1 hypothetical protein DY000_02030567 [Brassica cretica]